MTGSDGQVPRVVVISPHLDDAAFSLGATIRRLSRAGTPVDVVTVLAGDPASAATAGPWDLRAGFTTAGEAARARREEDRRACAVLGARPIRLPYADEQYDPTVDPEEAWENLAPLVAGADRILVPGFPLSNPDHRWTAELVLRRVRLDLSVGVYAEQPYASWARPGAPPREPVPGVEADPWRPMPCSLADRVAKLRACRCYRSQLRVIHPRPARLAVRVWRYERSHGGELVAPVSSTNRHR